MPKARTRTLTLEAIVDESLEIVRQRGVSGLTMRGVAAHLGVTPMAVYYYVADKDDLLRLAVDRVVASTGALTRQPDESWQAALHEYLLSMWENSRKYPGLSAHMINLPSLGMTPERLNAGITFFEEAGFSSVQARLAYSFATTYIHGRLSVDAHLSQWTDGPHLDGARAHDVVEFGVEAVIRALEARLKQQDAANGQNPLSSAGRAGGD